MDRIRKLWQGEQAYEPLDTSVASLDPAHEAEVVTEERLFSWLEYGVFLLLGIAMLWAWNMFLAAGPYFQRRFQDNRGIYDNFQAAEISVSTVTSLVAMLLLTRRQVAANYPRRIMVALQINTVIFVLLAISTAVQTGAEVYFGFLIVMVFTTSLATALIQNGIFAYVSSFAMPQYTQGIMTGQAVAGVLPCLAQIVSVLSVRNDDTHSTPENGTPQVPAIKSNAAMAYFLTAAIISLLTLSAFVYLRRRRVQSAAKSAHPGGAEEPSTEQAVPISLLISKLGFLASAVILVFAITMVYPVFTQQITSVRPPMDQPPLLQPASFIPLAFLFWNSGDLVGRLLTAVSSLSLVRRPRVVLILAALRIFWIGLYQLCNVGAKGATVNSDFFYLVVVQLLFGLTNGYLGSTCMIGAAEWVAPEERAAAGGFMSLCLVIGLTLGSVASFAIGK